MGDCPIAYYDSKRVSNRASCKCYGEYKAKLNYSINHLQVHLRGVGYCPCRNPQSLSVTVPFSLLADTVAGFPLGLITTIPVCPEYPCPSSPIEIMSPDWGESWTTDHESITCFWLANSPAVACLLLTSGGVDPPSFVAVFTNKLHLKFPIQPRPPLSPNGPQPSSPMRDIAALAVPDALQEHNPFMSNWLIGSLSR